MTSPQPASPPLPVVADDPHGPVVDVIIAALRHLPGALLPMLHGIQDRLGFIPPAAIPRLADALNLSRAEVHGVVTFYHDFRVTPPGRHVVRLCRAEACQAMGCARLEDRLRERFDLDFHRTTPDGALTLEPVYCLGNCAASPSIQIDGELRGRVTPERLESWLQELVREPQAQGRS